MKLCYYDRGQRQWCWCSGWVKEPVNLLVSMCPWLSLLSSVSWAALLWLLFPLTTFTLLSFIVLMQSCSQLSALLQDHARLAENKTLLQKAHISSEAEITLKNPPPSLPFPLASLSLFLSPFFPFPPSFSCSISTMPCTKPWSVQCRRNSGTS